MTPEPPLLLLAQGDAETWDSWSGSSRSVVQALRALGREVRTADVEPSGLTRWIAAAAAVSSPRRRWSQRYHHGSLMFRRRSALARRAIAAHPLEAPILQIGAGFDPGPTGGRPLYCFCDSNAAFSARGGRYGPVSHLSQGERERLVARERRIYGACTGVFAMTEGLRRSFIEDFGIAPDRVVTTWAGANLPALPTPADLDHPKADAPTILFVGRQFERKGGPDLVSAFTGVVRAVPDAQLVIAGCRPDLPPMPNVRVLGLVPRANSAGAGLGGLFLSSDVFCMPSRFEAFGVVFCEAMLHGLPCVGSREYASEIISDGVDGWLVPVGDVSRLTEVLVRALGDRQRLRAMGRRGREKALALFTWDRVARAINGGLTHTGAPASGNR